MAACPNCSTEATGAFCSTCGAALTAPSPTPPLTSPEAPPAAAPLTPPIAPPSAPSFTAGSIQPPSEYATWLRRVGGSLIDALVFGIPFAALLIGGFAWGFSTVHLRCVDAANGTTSCHSLPGSTFSAGGGVLMFLAAIWALAWLVYVVVAIGGPRGATVGMRALQLRCVRDLTFDQVGMGKSVLRLLVTTVLGVIWVGSLVDDLFPLWDSKHQTLHDKAVETVVLRTAL